MLPFVTLSLEVVSGYLIHEDAESNIEFFLRIDVNKDEKLSYKELVDAKIEEVTLKIINLILDFPNHNFFFQNKDEIAKYLGLQENDKVEKFKANTAQHILVLMEQFDKNSDSFLDKNELHLRSRGPEYQIKKEF